MADVKELDVWRPMERATARVSMKCMIVVNTPTPWRLGTERRQEEEEPRSDYLLLAASMDAQIVAPQRGAARRSLAFRFYSYLSQAWRVFRRRHEYDVVLTMSEQVGLLLALLFKVARCKKTHIMVSHYMTPSRKSAFLRLLHVDSHITKFICYGTVQAAFLTRDLGVPKEKVEFVLHPKDQLFWRPMPLPEERMIFSAGMLARDYDALVEAVEGLDVDVVIAASSPWVNGKKGPPPGRVLGRVKFVQCTPSEMRELYARSMFVVVPLVPVNIQAGSMVIYESMAMGKAVVTTANGGNVDIVRDGETGHYVPPGDPKALRQAITRLLENPSEARRMGDRGRELVEKELNMDTYVQRVLEIVREAYRWGDRGSGAAAQEVKAR